MAAIQKIRSYGVVLICIVGIALFAFIAEELVRAVSNSRNMDRQIIGEIYGENINYEQFNKLYEEYENTIKMSNGGQSLDEEQSTRLRDQVWQEYVTQKLIEHEAQELGLKVTDAELKQIITKGTSPVLMQTPFTNPKTNMFDVAQLKQFLAQYDEVMQSSSYPAQAKEQVSQLMRYWRFIEQQVRHQALIQKYQSLLGACFLSNEVCAKANYEARNSENSIFMAAVPYSAVKDKNMQPTESELKAKYKEMKQQYPEMFSTQQELRDIKYIAVPIKASKDDEQELRQEMQEYAKRLAQEGANINQIVRESRSVLPYNGLYVSRASLPQDIMAQVDSMTAGTQKGPYTNYAQNTLNVIRYIGKIQQPDSVEFVRLDIPGTDAAATTKADSILSALQKGAPMDTIAKRYNQAVQAIWLTSQQIDGAQLNEENRTFINTLFNAPQGQYTKIKNTGGYVIVKVTNRKNIIEKYNVAVIKREIAFSNETATKAYNKFSSFLAANPTIEDIEANAAKEGYTVMSTDYLASNGHYIANIKSTTELLRWTFDKAKKGDISELTTCGANNDQLLVVMLTDIHKKGDRDINDPNLKNILEQEVIKDKTAAYLLEKFKKTQNIDQVIKMEGAVSDTIEHISFSSPVYVQKLAGSEPALSGAVAAAKEHQYVNGVRGYNGVYAFKHLKRETKNSKYDKEFEQQQLSTAAMRNMNSLIQVLIRKANIQDKRYKFYQ